MLKRQASVALGWLEGPATVETDSLDAPELNQKLIAEARRLLAPHEIQEACEVFHGLDADGSGALDADEIFEAIKISAPNITRAQVAHLVSEFDDSGDGEIQLDEFLLMHARICDAGGVKHHHHADNTKSKLSFAAEVAKYLSEEDAGGVAIRGSMYVNIGGLTDEALKRACGTGCTLHVEGNFVNRAADEAAR